MDPDRTSPLHTLEISTLEFWIVRIGLFVVAMAAFIKFVIRELLE